MGSHVASLGVNPASRDDGRNVLRRKVVLLAVDDVIFHELVQLVKVKEGDHGVKMVLGVKVGVPKKNASDEVGAHRTSVSEAIGDLGDFAVGVFQVANVVDHGVSNENRHNPPEKHGFQAFASLANGRSDGDVERQLHQSRTLELGHDTRFLGVVEFLETPARARVVDGNAQGRKDDATRAALEGGKNVEETHEVGVSTGRQVAEAGVLEGLARVKAGEFRVLVNMVGEGVVLLVHHTFVFTELKTEKSGKEEGPVIDRLGLPGVAVKEFMLAGKGKALELEAVEKVERDKHEKLFLSQTFLIERKDTQSMNGIGGARHDGKIKKEALESLSVGLLHKPNEDSVVEDTVTLLAFTVLDIGPIFILGVDTCKTCRISLFVEHGSQLVFEGRFLVFRRFLKEDGGHAGIRRHVGLMILAKRLGETDRLAYSNENYDSGGRCFL